MAEPDLRRMAHLLADRLADELALAESAAQGVTKVAVPDGVEAGCAVVKQIDEQRYTLGLAYPAMKPDVGKALDGFRDFASHEVVEKAAWGFARDHRSIGLMHADGTEGAGEVVESYVYRGPDWTMKAADGTETTIVAGDWLLGVVWTPPAWAAIKSGKVQGLSFHGKARRSVPDSDRLAELRA